MTYWNSWLLHEENHKHCRQHRPHSHEEYHENIIDYCHYSHHGALKAWSVDTDHASKNIEVGVDGNLMLDGVCHLLVHVAIGQSLRKTDFFSATRQ
jgi:hypothetical protein